jgi:hypothetical protein
MERLFLKESEEQGKHFDDPKSVAKIVLRLSEIANRI